MAHGEIRAILTDIEGTTSSIAFVTETLFPYARERLADYVVRHADAVAPLLAQVPGDPVETLTGWIDADRKDPVLKQLQGMIWADGYADGSLVGHVYPDAADALRRWHAAGLGLHVYSSGSIAAQKLLFRHSSAGDLTPLFSGWFDLTSGSKLDADSYARIVDAIGEPASAILFLSDSPAEIAAADAAGLATMLIARAGGSGVPSFADIKP